MERGNKVLRAPSLDPRTPFIIPHAPVPVPAPLHAPAFARARAHPRALAPVRSCNGPYPTWLFSWRAQDLLHKTNLQRKWMLADTLRNQEVMARPTSTATPDPTRGVSGRWREHVLGTAQHGTTQLTDSLHTAMACIGPRSLPTTDAHIRWGDEVRQGRGAPCRRFTRRRA